MSEQPFQHGKLENSKTQIRLLRIHALTGHDLLEQINCSVEIVDFDASLRYTAVSYVWGSKTSLNPILLNGQLYNISANLHKAMLQMRETWESIQDSQFWIDQICIDQDDKLEKADQIANMDQIYAAASKTVVWLGPEPERERKRKRDRMLDNDSSEVSSYRSLSWHSLCQNDYWSRLWIVQEICFSTSIVIMLGRKAMQWQEFINGFKELGSSDYNFMVSERAQLIHHLVETKIRISERRKLHPMQELPDLQDLTLNAAISRFGSQRCSDARDKLYGLMSLVRSKDRITVDYTISAEQLYERAVDHAQQHIPLRSDHAAFCVLLLGRLDLDSSEDVRINLPGSTQYCSAVDIWAWHDRVCEDPSELESLPTISHGDTDCRSIITAKSLSERRIGLRHIHSGHQPLGCPMVKANPKRYESVSGPCTNLLGISPSSKALHEHLKKQHSRQNRCLTCMKWHAREEDLRLHLQAKPGCYRCSRCCKEFVRQEAWNKHLEARDPCDIDEARRPELFTVEQEQAFMEMKNKSSSHSTLEDKYRFAFSKLWPDHPARFNVTPFYDFAVLTHMLPSTYQNLEGIRNAPGGLTRPEFPDDTNRSQSSDDTDGPNSMDVTTGARTPLEHQSHGAVAYPLLHQNSVFLNPNTGLEYQPTLSESGYAMQDEHTNSLFTTNG